MEVKREGSLPFLGTELLNSAPKIESKVYIKRTNTGLLLHFQSHVDIKYKRSLVNTMVDRAYRLSSNWSFFSEECDRLRGFFHNLKYPKPLVETKHGRQILLTPSGLAANNTSKNLSTRHLCKAGSESK